MAGDKTYSQSARGSTVAAALQAAQPLIAAADQVRSQGLPEDLKNAQVTSLDQIIQTAEQTVG
jgi:hypothetical protein